MGLVSQQNTLSVWTPEDEQLIIDTYCKGATPSEFKLFKSICAKTNLCPISKQIYAVFRWDSKLGRDSMTTQTSIDGLRLVAERTECYAPGRASEYKYDSQGNLLSATSFVKKYTKDGTWHEVSYEADFSEYCQKFHNKKTGKQELTQFWAKMPKVMLAKVAEAAALRKAFPHQLAGLYIKEEMDQADVVTVEHEDISPRSQKKPQINIQIQDIKPRNPLENNSSDPIIAANLLSELNSKYELTEEAFKNNCKKYILEKWNVSDFSQLKESQAALVTKWIEVNLEKIKRDVEDHAVVNA